MRYHNLTLRDVSAIMGAAISMTNTWRNGRIPSAWQAIEEIAKLFKVSPACLVHGMTQNPKEILLGQGAESQEIVDVEHYIPPTFGSYFENYANDKLD